MVAEELLQSLKSKLGDRCITDKSTLELYGTDYSHHSAGYPDVLVMPTNEEEIVYIVKLCEKYRTPIIPYGSGTSLEGHITAPAGGVCLSVKQMDKILRIDPRSMDVTVQPGISFVKLNQEIKKYGLFFPLDAGPDASIGGMVCTCASGTKAVRYGTMKENTLALRVILPNGKILKTGSRARKSVSGYDLTRLFVASEGTLGVVSEITLRIHKIPENCTSALLDFPTIEDAANTVIELMNNDMALSMVELLDDVMMKAINKKYKFKYAERPTLYLEFAGTKNQLKDQESTVRKVAANFNVGSFVFAKEEKEREELWKARKAALFASTSLKPGSKVWTTDVCVPISKLADCISETKNDLLSSTIIAPIVGHVGDGNFHLFILLDPDNKDELKEANRINDRLVKRAIAMDGTCTGEHGVGIGKIEYLESELGTEAIELMKKIKKLIDPYNIMNPGKKIVIHTEDFNSKILQIDNNTISLNSNNTGLTVGIEWQAKL